MWAVGQNGTQPGAGLEQFGGFGPDDFEVSGFVEAGVVHVHQLLHFALRDDVGGFGEDFHDPHVLGLHHHLEGAGVQKIPDKHAGWIAKRFIGGRPASAQGGVVHDIIVQQGGCMDELDDGCQVEVLRALDEDFPTVHFVYVLEEDSEKLVGVLSMRTLVLAHRESQLKDIMYTEIISVPPDEDEEEVAADISKYDMVALPVVDESGRMLGLVTVDDAMEVMEESTESEKSTSRALTVVAGVIGGAAALAVYTLIVLEIAGVL